MAFDIDANGILNVSAKDVASGKQQQITITASSGLSKQDVDRMVKEADAHASEDAQRRQEIELRNQTDALVYSTERTLAEHGAKLSDTERASVEQALSEAREALEGGGRRAHPERPGRPDARLPDARHGHEPPVRQRRGRAPAVGGPQGGDVVDAEFKDVEDRKS